MTSDTRRHWIRLATCSALAFAVGAALGACGSSTPSDTTPTGDDTSGDDAATGDDGGPDANAIYDTPVVCTSNTHWTHNDLGNEDMHPGRACVSCHQQNGGPTLTIAGTVYPTAHEPDDCNGVFEDAGVTVVITDAHGKQIVLVPNTAGNFIQRSAVATPFHAKVVRAGVERAMSASQVNGDCNFCHTQNGANSAPGRIMAP